MSEPTLQAQLLRLLSDASLEPRLREGVERMSAIHAATDGSNFAAVVRMLEEMGADAKRSREHLEGVRGQLAQVVGNQPLITDHLTRQDTKLETVSEGITSLRSEFSLVAESVSDLQLQMGDARVQLSELTTRVGTYEDRLDRKRARIEALEHEVAVLRARLDARPSPEKAHATYTAMRWLVEQAGGDPDALGLPQEGSA